VILLALNTQDVIAAFSKRTILHAKLFAGFNFNTNRGFFFFNTILQKNIFRENLPKLLFHHLPGSYRNNKFHPENADLSLLAEAPFPLYSLS